LCHWNPRKRRERGQGIKHAKKIMAPNSPNLVKGCRFKEAGQTTSKKKKKKTSIPKHIIVKLLKTKDKEKNLKAAREKHNLPLEEKQF